MDVSLFDYELPPERIAQSPAEPRDAARLLVLERQSRGLRHSCVADLPELLAPGDLLVINDTRVIPARLVTRKPTGGRVEVLLLEPEEAREPGRERWTALIGASRVPGRGARLVFGEDLELEVFETPREGDGVARVELRGEPDVRTALERRGRPPLPPYIERADDDPRYEIDRERYQTVFARAPGAVAAPTAGLHFTSGLLDRLEQAGIRRTSVTLHVGAGTFRPVQVRRTEEVRLHEEAFAVPPSTAEAIARTRRDGGRVIAVGTTVTRALESRPSREDGAPAPGRGRTDLFIAPGHRFLHLDGLMTNFHLPRSSLLMLVSALAGRERLLAAYREAVELGYRFYSYGDAMLVL
jgi:S-adenosylmethionine:tRNA ribosyltransferase-isomerase